MNWRLFNWQKLKSADESAAPNVTQLVIPWPVFCIFAPIKICSE